MDHAADVGEPSMNLASFRQCMACARAGWFLSLAAALALAGGSAFSAESEVEAQARVLGQAHATVVGLRVQAVPDARSSRSLGPLREGSGVVIGDDGLVLT